MDIVTKSRGELIPYENNPRHNDEAVEYVANSIKEFGWKVPVVIDKNNVLVAGHTRLKAAEMLGIDEIPCVIADDLSEDQIKAYRLADNKVGELAGWDFDALDFELDEIELDMSEFGFDVENFDSDGQQTNEIKEVDYEEKISVVIECENDEQAEMTFERLTEEGYSCRILTL